MIGRDVYTGSADHCPAATEFMSLSADGELLPCNFLQFSLGNVCDYSVESMRAAILQSPWFDGAHPNCIIGEDRDFLRQFVEPHLERPKPLDAYSVFPEVVRPVTKRHLR